MKLKIMMSSMGHESRQIVGQSPPVVRGAGVVLSDIKLLSPSGGYCILSAIKRAGGFSLSFSTGQPFFRLVLAQRGLMGYDEMLAYLKRGKMIRVRREIWLMSHQGLLSSQGRMISSLTPTSIS
jgi:hypothetical protein